MVITITSALRECRLPAADVRAYIYIRGGAKSSRDVGSKLYTYVPTVLLHRLIDRSTCAAFGALYGCSSFLAGEFRDRCAVYDSYRTLLVCVWD